MSFVFGALLIVVGILTVALCLLGARNPKLPWWGQEDVIGLAILPLALGAAILGLAVAIHAVILEGEAANRFSDFTALAVVGGGVAALLAMRIPHRLKRYEQMRDLPEIIALAERRAARKQAKNRAKPARHAA